MSRFRKALRQMSLYDIVSPFILLVTLLPALILKITNKIRKKPIWLVTERKDTASDNAYWFYCYLKEKHKDINSWYVIDRKCQEYKNVEKFGNIIQYKSLKHWIYYLASDRKISSQKASNPAPALFYILHVYLNLFNNRIYLKHGIIKDDADWWHYNHTKYSKVTCGAREEYDFVKKNFGYPDGNVVYTGLARFDNLHDSKVRKNQILVMPTWRNWLGGEKNIFAKNVNFKKTNYYKAWNSLLSSPELADLLNKNDLILVFYPHHNMQEFIGDFDIRNGRIQIASDVNVQELLKESALLITDFSSVFMDFAYMGKPMIFYQFDEDEYRSKQYQKGYFDYRRDGFGDVMTDMDKVVEKIRYYVERDLVPEKKYTERMQDFFTLCDTKNCERIYEAIK